MTRVMGSCSTLSYLARGFKADPYFSAVKGDTGKNRTAHSEARIQERTPAEFEAAVRIVL